jgi:hypothetical protein
LGGAHHGWVRSSAPTPLYDAVVAFAREVTGG